jgi:hypothetical protein
MGKRLSLALSFNEIQVYPILTHRRSVSQAIWRYVTCSITKVLKKTKNRFLRDNNNDDRGKSQSLFKNLLQYPKVFPSLVDTHHAKRTQSAPSLSIGKEGLPI